MSLSAEIPNQSQAGAPSLPFVSVILPVRNEQNHIVEALSAVFAQDYPADRIEILVADGLSTDRTRAVLGDLQRQHPNLAVLENPGMIVPTGLNQAIRRAKGEIIVRVDGHTRIAPDYVHQCVEGLLRTGADNVGGRIISEGKTLFGQAAALATSSPFGVGGSRFHFSEEDEWVDTVPFGAWRRELFERIGLFDEELVRDQDDEFNYRIARFGGRIRLLPQIRSYYISRSSPKGLFRQYFQYGYWKVRVLQKHPRQMSLRQFVPPLFALSLVAAGVWALFSKWGRRLLALVAGSYGAANLAASVSVARRHGSRHLPRLPLAFALVHLGYGFGFLAGLVRFFRRWQRYSLDQERRL